LNYKVWTGFGILEKELVAGPFASSPRQPIAACPGPRTCGNAPVAWSPPATSRRRGRPPATPPPRAVHAVTAPGALSRAATVQRRSQFHFLDSSRQRSPLFPCRRLPSLAVTTSSAPAPYAAPPASSSTSRAPPCPGVPHRTLLPH
jgi:hypothetical protein